MNAYELLVGGIPIAVGVFLVVQALKVFGFVNGDSAGKAAIITALVFGAFAAVGLVYPPALQYVELGFQVFVGAMVAGLFYEYIAKPILEGFGGNISAKDLSK